MNNSENIVIGRYSECSYSRCIILGEKQEAKCDYHFLLNFGGVRIEDVLTQEEWRPLYEAFQKVIQAVNKRYPNLQQQRGDMRGDAEKRD